MTKRKFEEQLRKASKAAVDFSKQYITNRIFPELDYDLILNSNKDVQVNWDSRHIVFGEKRVIRGVSFNEAVACLCRSERVPVWIDISVVKSSWGRTRLQLLCAGRFTDHDHLLYYYKQGSYPFGIKSPLLPPWIEEDEKYYLLFCIVEQGLEVL